MKLPFHDKKFVFLLIAIVMVLSLEILSIFNYHIPRPYEAFVFAALILGIGYNVLWSGLNALVHLKWSNINLLMGIAVLGAFYLGEYPEAAVLIVLYILGERLEDIGIDNSKSALDELVSKAPKMAFVKLENAYCAIDKIAIGTCIQIKPGEMLAMDGRIVFGETTVDEAAITGEPIPIDKHVGDTVFAGTLNKDGFIEIETTKLSVDTTFSKIIRLSFEAAANKSETQKFIQKFSKIYTPSIIILAILLFAVPVLFMGHELEHSLKQAISLLVIACPCALVISTPVAIYAAIGNASEKGAVIKGGKYLEALASVRAIGLDKTRTLTYGQPIVSDIIPMNGCSEEELLACSAGAEMFSEHPLAQAIVDASRKRGYEPHAANAFKSVMGKGATAKCLVCENEDIFVGKLDYIKEHQPIDHEAEKTVHRLSSEGKTSVVVSFGKGVAGIIGLMDEVKPESLQALAALRALNIEPVMLTGDNDNAAKYVADQLCIKTFYGNLLPENKAEKIKDLQATYQSVAMLGDGINDAPALAQSNVGIAMGAAGSDTAIETANIALMNDKLLLLPYLVKLSRKTLAKIKFNTLGAIIVKLFFIVLAFMGYSNLIFAIAADVGVTFLVIVNSLSLMKFKTVKLI